MLIEQHSFKTTVGMHRKSHRKAAKAAAIFAQETLKQCFLIVEGEFNIA